MCFSGISQGLPSRGLTEQLCWATEPLDQADEGNTGQVYSEFMDCRGEKRHIFPQAEAFEWWGGGSTLKTCGAKAKR